MELVLLGAVLVAAMATVDIPECQDEESSLPTNLMDTAKKPYGVHG